MGFENGNKQGVNETQQIGQGHLVREWRTVNKQRIAVWDIFLAVFEGFEAWSEFSVLAIRHYILQIIA